MAGPLEILSGLWAPKSPAQELRRPNFLLPAAPQVSDVDEYRTGLVYSSCVTYGLAGEVYIFSVPRGQGVAGNGRQFPGRDEIMESQKRWGFPVTGEMDQSTLAGFYPSGVLEPHPHGMVSDLARTNMYRSAYLGDRDMSVNAIGIYVERAPLDNSTPLGYADHGATPPDYDEILGNMSFELRVDEVSEISGPIMFFESRRASEPDPIEELIGPRQKLSRLESWIRSGYRSLGVPIQIPRTASIDGRFKLEMRDLNLTPTSLGRLRPVMLTVNLIGIARYRPR